MPFFRKKPVTIEARHYMPNSRHGREVSADEILRAQTPGTSENHAAMEYRRDVQRHVDEIQNWLAASGADYSCVNDAVHGPCIEIETLEGQMLARPGDWIIRGVKGEFYPCKPDIFAITYEAAE